ncbi:hypothetical protein Tco_1043487 [Tanacetum coccineum]|uniref:Uncharacterized protein n=1 Tax=Tanacetum coccineum TaxID=301880 RepID=A0ABQ5GPD3_9ASTR
MVRRLWGQRGGEVVTVVGGEGGIDEVVMMMTMGGGGFVAAEDGIGDKWRSWWSGGLVGAIAGISRRLVAWSEGVTKVVVWRSSRWWDGYGWRRGWQRRLAVVLAGISPE